MPRLLTYIKLSAAVLAWGGTFIAAKYAVIDTSVEVAALLRFVTASLALLIILYVHLGSLPRLNRQQVFYILLLGLSGVTTYNLFFFFGLKTVEAGRGALIITSNPIWVMLGSAWFFKHRIRFVHVMGLLLSSSGVSLVLSRGDLTHLFAADIGMGEFALLGSSLSWAVYTLLGKKLMHSDSPLSPLSLVTYSSISGSLLLALWIVLTGESFAADFTPALISSTAYLALLGTAAGFVWFFAAVKELGASQGAVFVFFVPVSAIIMGYIILDETITLLLLFGALLILSGVYLVNRPQKG